MKYCFSLFILKESVWDEPKEGFMTVAEYDRLNLVFDARQAQQANQESKYIRENADHLASKYRREEMKRLRAQPTEKDLEQEELERDNYTASEEAESSSAPYGKWQTVAPRYKYIFSCYQLIITNFKYFSS